MQYTSVAYKHGMQIYYRTAQFKYVQTFTLIMNKNKNKKKPDILTPP